MAYTTIDDPTIFFNTVLYTGNAASSHAITGVGFQPDWVWLKNRDASESHGLFDSVRGADKWLSSNTTSAETNYGGGYGVLSFDSDGFTVGNGTAVNQNSQKIVGWNWLAGNSTSSNSNGSITSSVSANNTAGFSIVSYTGTGSNATIGHGLGSALSMIIQKNLTTGTHSWNVFHKNLTSAGYNLNLNGTYAEFTSATTWNSTAPTSSVFSVGTDTNANESGSGHIAYCFAEKKGYSKFGSYTGNGNSDGPFIYLGFKPAWVLIKVTSTTNDWEIHDNKRQPFNEMNAILQPNLSDAETPSSQNRQTDFLSNGFKLRNGNTQNNLSGGSFIYMAFAESAFVNSNGVPTNAR